MQLNDQLSNERQFIEALKVEAVEKTQELNQALKTVEEDKVKLSEAEQALNLAKSAANSYQEKFDAQKPLLSELTMQIADKDAKLEL